MWFQKKIRLPALTPGFHLITDLLVSELPELERLSVGLAHFFLLHTSASLSLNENADPTVRHDFREYLNRLAPENQPYFRHTSEGPDDMPAHLKAGLLGTSLTIPITDGALALGTWQGIWLGEHRTHGGRRWVLVTVQGE
jgi:secondary thiamine-phosphate synthase enzyme